MDRMAKICGLNAYNCLKGSWYSIQCITYQYLIPATRHTYQAGRIIKMFYKIKKVKIFRVKKKKFKDTLNFVFNVK